MAKNKFSKYHDGDTVIVDRSGAGEAYQFGKVISSKPHKCGCNDSFEYEIEGIGHPIDEYYVRAADDTDLKLKELYEKLNIGEFEIDDTKIKRDFWKEQREPIKKAIQVMNIQGHFSI